MLQCAQDVIAPPEVGAYVHAQIPGSVLVTWTRSGIVRSSARRSRPPSRPSPPSPRIRVRASGAERWSDRATPARRPSLRRWPRRTRRRGTVRERPLRPPVHAAGRDHRQDQRDAGGVARATTARTWSVDVVWRICSPSAAGSTTRRISRRCWSMQGSVGEVAVDMAAADGRRMPVLITATLKPRRRPPLRSCAARYSTPATGAPTRGSCCAPVKEADRERERVQRLAHRVATQPAAPRAAHDARAGDRGLLPPASLEGGRRRLLRPVPSRRDTWGFFLGDVCGKGAGGGGADLADPLHAARRSPARAGADQHARHAQHRPAGALYRRQLTLLHGHRRHPRRRAGRLHRHPGRRRPSPARCCCAPTAGPATCPPPAGCPSGCCRRRPSSSPRPGWNAATPSCSTPTGSPRPAPTPATDATATRRCWPSPAGWPPRRPPPRSRRPPASRELRRGRRRRHRPARARRPTRLSPYRP